MWFIVRLISIYIFCAESPFLQQSQPIPVRFFRLSLFSWNRPWPNNSERSAKTHFRFWHRPLHCYHAHWATPRPVIGYSAGNLIRFLRHLTGIYQLKCSVGIEYFPLRSEKRRNPPCPLTMQPVSGREKAETPPPVPHHERMAEPREESFNVTVLLDRCPYARI